MFADNQYPKIQEFDRTPVLVGRRLLLNIAWLIALIIIAYLYLYSPAASPFEHFVPWYKWFVINFVPFLFLQALFHWSILNHLYKEERLGNIGWLIGMPILFFVVFWVVALILLVSYGALR